MATITFNEEESDITYEVDDLEIYGHLEPYSTGRTIAYRFVPDWFSNTTASDYFDANWENIEEEILKEFKDE